MDEKLIFLISLPRSGSTLLQHILANHSKIASSAEPWVLLHNLYAIKTGKTKAEYNSHIGAVALNDFINQTKYKQEDFYEAVKLFSNKLYSSFLENTNKDIFLDKTSRYHLVIEEIVKIYPDAKFIFLVRNPLDLFASYIETMVEENILRLCEDGIRDDLLYGYSNLLKGIDLLKDNSIIVKYESLIKSPEQTIKSILNYLNLDFETGILDYNKEGTILKGKLIDPKSIHIHTKPVNNYIDKWREKLPNQHSLYLAKSFLDSLDSKVLSKLGYDLEKYKSFFDNKLADRKNFISWKQLMIKDSEKSDSLKFLNTVKYYFNYVSFWSAFLFAIKNPTNILRWILQK